MKKTIITISVLALTIPQVAFSAWWNPFSWFQKPAPIIVEKIIYLPATTTPEVDSSTSELKKESVPKPIIKKVPPVVDNSAVIKAKLEADLKAQADKAEAEEKAKIQAQIKLDEDAYQQALENTRIQNDAIQNALKIKSDKLNAINLKIANLNAKYASDLKGLYTNSGSTLEQSDAFVRELNRQYEINYTALMAEFQQVKYSN